MIVNRTTASLALALGGALALTACGKKEQPAPAPPPAPAPATTPAPTTPPPAPAGLLLVSIDLGSAVGADMKVTETKTTFAPTDTIYAAVSTSGSAPSATIAAKWTYQDGQVVNEDSKAIAPTGAAVTTFQISKPDGWPAGSYQVAVSIDGKQAGSQSFQVQ